MTMAMISPSEREVSPVEQPRQNPRLALPRFRLVAAEFRPRRWLIIFYHRKTSRKMFSKYIKNTESKNFTKGATPCPRGWGHTPYLVGPLVALRWPSSAI